MAAITATGVSRLRAASKTHLEGVRRYFLDVIAAEDQAVIERSLERVSTGLVDKSFGAGSVCSTTAEA
jgi:hypothetical protein